MFTSSSKKIVKQTYLEARGLGNDAVRNAALSAFKEAIINIKFGSEKFPAIPACTSCSTGMNTIADKVFEASSAADDLFQEVGLRRLQASGVQLAIRIQSSDQQVSDLMSGILDLYVKEAVERIKQEGGQQNTQSLLAREGQAAKQLVLIQ